MSDLQRARNMPYHLTAEELAMYVAPKLDITDSKPRLRKWIKRSIFESSERVIFSGADPLIIQGLRRPMDVAVEMREHLPPDMGGFMPKIITNFQVKDTSFLVYRAPHGGEPLAEDIPRVVSSLIQMHSLLNKLWGERNYPEDLGDSTSPFKGLIKLGLRVEKLQKKIKFIIEKGKGLEIYHDIYYDYESGLLHGDVGIDNVFVTDKKVIFEGGPSASGSQLVDIAYLLESARMYYEDYDWSPVLDFLSDYYETDREKIEVDMVLATVICNADLINWFDRIVTELAPDYEDLYDHLIEERVEYLCDYIESKSDFF